MHAFLKSRSLKGKAHKNVPSHSGIPFFYLIFTIAVLSCKNEGTYTDYIKPDAVKATFTGSQSCVACHQQEYNKWQGSHHDLAMKNADSTSVLGNFNNVSFTHKGVKTRFFKKGEGFFVNTEGPDGQYHDYEVEYTFGVYPLQQYLVKFPRGQYQCLLTAWDSEKNKWFALQEDLDIHHEEWLHWSGGAMRWNTMCADCHSTNLQKNFDTQTEKYETSFSEINVSCEACHGPASLHTEYYKNPDPASDPPKMYMDKNMASQEVVDKCARCHSRRSQLTKYFDYEGHFLDHYDPALLQHPIYERDGQIKDEDYVYASFLQSKMYHSGVSCIDCHDVHTTKTKQTGNALCLNCHTPNYDTPSHHFHQENSEAALCVNCHMTGETYMGNDFRRDHSFRIPRPDQTAKYGTPNACNDCHEDKSARWASDFITSKYGEKRAEHFSDYLIPGQLGDYAALEHLITNTRYPDIVRATAIREYSNRPLSPREITIIGNYRDDPSGLVRNEVVRALVNVPNPQLSSYIDELLNDTIRLIRVSSARYFSLDDSRVPKNEAAFKKAREEFLEHLDMNADFPMGQHQIALYHQASGNDELAIKAYKKSIEMDNYNNTSRMNLALLLYTRGDAAASEKLYLKVIEQEPEYPNSYYMLGLLFHETGNIPKAMQYLSEACGLEIPHLRACYNYALLLQQNKRNEESISVTKKALQSFPRNENLLYVKLLGQLNTHQEGAAYNTVQELLEISPNNVGYQQIKKSIKPQPNSLLKRD